MGTSETTGIARLQIMEWKNTMNREHAREEISPTLETLQQQQIMASGKDYIDTKSKVKTCPNRSNIDQYPFET